MLEIEMAKIWRIKNTLGNWITMGGVEGHSPKKRPDLLHDIWTSQCIQVTNRTSNDYNMLR